MLKMPFFWQMYYGRGENAVQYLLKLFPRYKWKSAKLQSTIFSELLLILFKNSKFVKILI